MFGSSTGRERYELRPTVYLHCGLHKTGTSAIQSAFAEHRDVLRAHRLLYPATGHAEVGHHNLAWQIGGDNRFDPGAMTLDSAVEQIVAFDGDAVLSSEDFETFLDRPTALAPLADRLLGGGRNVRLVVYVRDASSYAESLFAELLGHGYSEPFDACVRQIRATGRLKYQAWVFQFDHRRIRSALAGFPGVRVIFRDYSAIAAAGSVVTDFLTTVGLPPDVLGATAQHRVNTRIPSEQALSLFYANRLGRPPDDTEVALIERLCRAAPARLAIARLDRLCSIRSVEAIASIASGPLDAPAKARAEHELTAWWFSAPSVFNSFRMRWIRNPIRAAASLSRSAR